VQYALGPERKAAVRKNRYHVTQNGSTNCPGCAAQMPFIRAVYDQRINAELTVLTIYREDKVSEVRSFVASKGYIFTALSDPNNEFATKCGFPHGAPITMFVDAKGVIKEFKCGPFQSQEEIENILIKRKQ
jgi:peroxiredoxin